MVVGVGYVYYVLLLLFVICLNASIIHTSGIGQLCANLPVVGPWLPSGEPTQRAVNTMGSNDLVVGKDHLLSCQPYIWQKGR